MDIIMQKEGDGAQKMTLGAIEAVMLVLNAADGKISGRTTIQKIVYFGTVQNLVKAIYRPHYYGPYSAEVADALQTVTSCHFVDEAMDTSDMKKGTDSFEWRRYTYSVNEEGNKVIDFLKTNSPKEIEGIRSLVSTCKSTANLDPNILSWAAKVNYILNQEKRSMTDAEIINVADTLNWKLSGPRVEKGVRLLKNLNLVTG